MIIFSGFSEFEGLAFNFNLHLPFCFVFLSLTQIPDVFPVLAAAHKALLSKARESLTTRTLHSELVYNYSGSKHVRL